MSYLALYRTFRPKTFDEIIGQEHIVRTLVNQIKTDKIGHAYLFCGARGTGKTTAAKVFARAINCLSPVNGSPCGKCEACRKLENPANLDIVEMDAASNNKVENVRDIRDKIQYPPVAGRYKVYIIDEVHMLTPEAFNALLKTLEEPPAHAVFILATTEVHKIPATILSRCLHFDFKLIPTQTIAAHVASLYDKIGKKYTPEAVGAIARAGEGSVRDALSVADVCVSFSDKELTYDDVIEVLGTSDRTRIEKLLGEIVDGNTGGILSCVDELCMHGKSVSVLNRDVCTAIRDLLVIKTCSDPKAILGLPDDKLAELKRLADKTEVHALLRYLELFSEAEADLKYSTHPRIVFETAAIKAGMPQTDYNIDALLTRITALEKKLAELAARPVVLPAVEQKPVVLRPESDRAKTVMPETKAASQTKSTDQQEKTLGEDGNDRSDCGLTDEETGRRGSVNSSAVTGGVYDVGYDEIPPEEEAGFYIDAREKEKSGSSAQNNLTVAVKATEEIAGYSGKKIGEDVRASGKTAGGGNVADAEKAWGAMLRAMRKDKEIMLWAACEDVSVYANGGIFFVSAGGDNEYTFLSKPENFEKLKKYVFAEGFTEVKLITEGDDVEIPTDVDGEQEKVEKLFQGERLTIKDNNK